MENSGGGGREDFRGAGFPEKLVTARKELLAHSEGQTPAAKVERRSTKGLGRYSSEGDAQKP